MRTRTRGRRRTSAGGGLRWRGMAWQLLSMCADRGPEEGPVARRPVPPADAELARDHDVSEPPFGVDVAAERDVAEALLPAVSPAHGLHGPERACGVDAHPDL